MKSQSITTVFLSMMMVFSMTISIGQETTDSVPDKLYQDYKQNGIDKALQTYDKSPVKGNEYTFLSEPLNVLGYRIMHEGNLNAAEKVFLAQIDEYPNEANPYDSYADLLMEKGNEEEAKKHYKKAIDLSATMEDLEAKAQMLEASKTKLAKLDGTGSDLHFLEGKWAIKNYGYQDGKKTLRTEGNLEFLINEDNTLLTGVLRNKEGKYMGTRIIAYDAVDEQYEMVWVGNSLTGIDPSTIKIQKSTPDQIVMIEEYEENGEMKKAKHILKRKSGEIAWDIFDLSDSGSSDPVAHMSFKRNE